MPESALGLGLLADDVAEYIGAAFEKKAERIASARFPKARPSKTN
jgi:hypothetical protein